MSEYERGRSCIFCRIVEGTTPAKILHRESSALVVVPLRPVVDGHVIVMPEVHVENFADDPEVYGEVSRVAAVYAGRGTAGRYGSANVITSKGRPATQSIRHLHVHLVPRRFGDGLLLPWTFQSGRRRLDASMTAESKTRLGETS